MLPPVLAHAEGPAARIQFVMAYDARRDRVVLFGGMDAQGVYRDDVWEFDGTRWTQRYP
ncbi:MAG: kelch repeat-containing protein [Asticcacaulis sp.]